MAEPMPMPEVTKDEVHLQGSQDSRNCGASPSQQITPSPGPSPYPSGAYTSNCSGSEDTHHAQLKKTRISMDPSQIVRVEGGIRRESTNTTTTTSTAHPRSFLQRHISSMDLDGYVDTLAAEDVGFSFCIRAPADFNENLRRSDRLRLKFGSTKHMSKKMREHKHLYGLDNILVQKTDEEVEQKAGEREAKRESTRSGVSIPEEIERSKPGLIQERLSNLRMPYSAISSMSSKVHLALSTSAMLSFLYVIGYCAVQPACSHGGMPIFVWAHLINSVIYGMTAIPSRGLFSRIDWRIGEELTSPVEVFAVDLRSPGLYFDIVALAGLFAELAHHIESGHVLRPNSPLPTTSQWLILLQMVKVWRFVLPEETAESQRSFLQGILKLLFSLLIFAHIIGCTFLIVGHLEQSQGSASWLDKHLYIGLDMNHCVVRYTESFYFAVIGLTSVGYGDLMVTSLEHNLNSFFLLISQLFAAKICAELTWLTSMYNQHESDVHERRRRLVLALNKMGAPKVLVKRVLAFLTYENAFHADNMENKTFDGLSKNLTAELRLCTYRNLVIQAPFLREQPTEVISIIVNALSDAVYLPSDFIVRAGEPGRELFFVRRGEARAFLGLSAPVWGQSEAVAVMKTGSYFGELAMLTGLPRGSFVMATNYCICSILPYCSVEDLVDMHPEAFTTLVQTMVRMYKLKPKMTWQGLTSALIKTVGIDNDLDAFTWFRSHSEFLVDELCAKAFDLALIRLKVSHLDRRIFWSELDKDATGGVEFKDFKGKLHFREDSESSGDESVPSVASQPIRNEEEQVSLKGPDVFTTLTIVRSVSDESNDAFGPSCPASTAVPSASPSFNPQACSNQSTPAPQPSISDSFQPIMALPGTLPDIPNPLQLQPNSLPSSSQAPAVDAATWKSLSLLLEENTRLLSEVQRLNLTS